MQITVTPIGYVETQAETVPRYWAISDVTGRLILEEPYAKGLDGLYVGQKIFVIFAFHKSPAFTPELIYQKPRNKKMPKGVFSISSPVRPNPIGLSVVEVLGISGNAISVKGLDMLNGTPILDIKPCPHHSF